MTKRPVFVDTQLLVLLFASSADLRFIVRHKRTSSLYMQSDFDLFLDLLGFAPKFVFCLHGTTDHEPRGGSMENPIGHR